MSKVELLQQYKNDVNNLRKCAKELNLSDKEIDDIFKQCFSELKRENSTHSCRFLTICKLLLISPIFCLFIYVLLNVHQPTSSLVLRNVQGLIYPGLKVLRFATVPIIKLFPSLTALYDESCLVENPYFYVSDMECWPCENVHSVIDLTGFDNHSLYDSGTPYIAKTHQKEIFFEDLQHLYRTNKATFNSETQHIKSTNFSMTTLEEIFESELPSSTHITWRINKMSIARIIRNLFPRPELISEWSGQSIERFLMLDGPEANPYILPSPECSYVLLFQSTGERTIILKPSNECGATCRTVSVVLKPTYILWYNWWYWRPISLPVENSKEVSITYLSSYC